MSAALSVMTAYIFQMRAKRMAEGRPAQPMEAYVEMFALQEWRMTPTSMRQAARDLGWSPGKLRRAYEAWETHAVGDPEFCPRRPTADRA